MFSSEWVLKVTKIGERIRISNHGFDWWKQLFLLADIQLLVGTGTNTFALIPDFGRKQEGRIYQRGVRWSPPPPARTIVPILI